ncbi:MAG: hypothetical protein A3D31_15750 [Candidatus Fluviicola riflensis]|nr:MAG: hypothetical protein CHH17_00685 [Candidatus Fluviicola riflensis]OGS78413.1 MAG: hypothetical protein A3D31_15750 [Candidatus Fluviicola riflensis]OGS85479.1 MAG: hypothetical protein A2724_12685 [Fluviicola sp. RIFCSPHIGHO2_01_FULL_43_53]OGS87520.1 MAG: hypothetical protein A3E30_09105 [Fluviicola sp. RIFCSPHIGHO2_12_FULL_43_24]
MNILRFFTIGALVLISITSCTIVTSTNVPGKTATKFPKNMSGKYILQYPEELSMLAVEGSDTYVTFKGDEMIVDNTDGQTITKLGDSLFFSTIGKQQYLSFGVSPQINVFKVVKNGKNIELFSMCGDVTSSGDLTNFFSNVKEIPGEVDENGDTGAASYEVTIIDGKLNDYFESSIPMKEPFVLKKQ